MAVFNEKINMTSGDPKLVVGVTDGEQVHHPPKDGKMAPRELFRNSQVPIEIMQQWYPLLREPEKPLSQINSLEELAEAKTKWESQPPEKKPPNKQRCSVCHHWKTQKKHICTSYDGIALECRDFTVCPSHHRKAHKCSMPSESTFAAREKEIKTKEQKCAAAKVKAEKEKLRPKAEHDIDKILAILKQESADGSKMATVAAKESISALVQQYTERNKREKSREEKENIPWENSNLFDSLKRKEKPFLQTPEAKRPVTTKADEQRVLLSEMRGIVDAMTSAQDLLEIEVSTLGKKILRLTACLEQFSTPSCASHLTPSSYTSALAVSPSETPSYRLSQATPSHRPQMTPLYSSSTFMDTPYSTPYSTFSSHSSSLTPSVTPFMKRESSNPIVIDDGDDDDDYFINHNSNRNRNHNSNNKNHNTIRFGSTSSYYSNSYDDDDDRMFHFP